MNEVIDAGGIKGIPADQQGLNGKHLSQTGIFEVTADQLPDRTVTAQPDQVRHLADHGAEAMERLVGQLREAYVKNLFRLRQQIFIALHIGGIESLNFFQRILKRTAVVKVITIGKLETIPWLDRNQFYIVLGLAIEEGEQFIKQKGRGQHRRTGIVSEPVPLKHLCPAACARATVQYRNVISLGP